MVFEPLSTIRVWPVNRALPCWASSESCALVGGGVSTGALVTNVPMKSGFPLQPEGDTSLRR